MTTSLAKHRPSRSRLIAENEPRAKYVVVGRADISVTLHDGRVVAVPLDWYPRLVAGTSAERNYWKLIGGGTGVHWPDLDEDVSVESMIAGRRSMESPNSLDRWRAYRARGEKVPVTTLSLPDWMKRKRRLKRTGL